METPRNRADIFNDTCDRLNGWNRHIAESKLTFPVFKHPPDDIPKTRALTVHYALLRHKPWKYRFRFCTKHPQYMDKLIDDLGRHDTFPIVLEEVSCDTVAKISEGTGLPGYHHHLVVEKSTTPSHWVMGFLPVKGLDYVELTSVDSMGASIPFKETIRLPFRGDVYGEYAPTFEMIKDSLYESTLSSHLHKFGILDQYPHWIPASFLNFNREHMYASFNYNIRGTYTEWPEITGMLMSY